jgi:hypothetical protein
MRRAVLHRRASYARGDRAAALAFVLALAIAGCGSDADPLQTRCESVCSKVEPGSPCNTPARTSQCVADCKTLAAKAQSTNGKSCGECVADSFKYNAKPGCTTGADCCWGTSNAAPNDPECKGKCFEPDASVGF